MLFVGYFHVIATLALYHWTGSNILLHYIVFCKLSRPAFWHAFNKLIGLFIDRYFILFPEDNFSFFLFSGLQGFRR